MSDIHKLHRALEKYYAAHPEKKIVSDRPRPRLAPPAPHIIKAAVTAQPTEQIDVEDLGAIYLRKWTPQEAADFWRWIRETGATNISAKLVAECALTETGTKLFTRDDADKLGEWPCTTFDELIRAFTKLNAEFFTVDGNITSDGIMWELNAARVQLTDNWQDGATIDGTKKSLTFLRWKIVKALVAAGVNGLSKSELEDISTGALRILRELRAEPAWSAVIKMARVKGGRYRIAAG